MQEISPPYYKQVILAFGAGRAGVRGGEVPLRLIGTKRFPPQDFRALAMLSGTKLWLSNLHVIIIFGVYNK